MDRDSAAAAARLRGGLCSAGYSETKWIVFYMDRADNGLVMLGKNGCIDW